MYNLVVENGSGEKLTLTGNEEKYQIVNIEGLNPPNATINTSTIVGMDGSTFMSSKLENRNIVITIKITGDTESNRIQLYQFFRTKHWCKIYYNNSHRDVYAEGYVESMENNLFQQSQTIQISIVCPDPYLKAVQEIVNDISKVLGKFTFPFSITSAGSEFSTYESNRLVTIDNDGETDIGLEIRLEALGTVVYPVIYNVITGEFFRVRIHMEKGYVIHINTNPGKKSITATINGNTSSYIHGVDPDSTWLSVRVGENEFTYDAQSGVELLSIEFKHRVQYEGI